MSQNDQPKLAPTGFLARFAGWPLLMVILGFIWLASRPGTNVAAVHCGVDIAQEQVDVVMLTAEWCSYCRQARRLLVNKSIKYCEHDIEHSDSGRKLYQQSSARVIPIIQIGEDTLIGYSKTQILETLAAHDLFPLEEL